MIDKDDLEYVTDRKPTDNQILDLPFAWKVCKYVKSNAIIFAKDQQTIVKECGRMHDMGMAVSSVDACNKALKIIAVN